MSHYRFETKVIHTAQIPDTDTRSRAVPIYRTSAYAFKDTEQAANLFSLKELGNIYTRLMNPTQDILEKRLADLENGQAALALASGTAAIFNSIINLAAQGDEIISSSNLYGGTFTLFDAILPKFGITVKLVDSKDPAGFKAALSNKTKAIYVEAIGNPTLDVIDIEAVAQIAQSAHVPLIVDATFATPYLMQPINHGADIVVHSLTKWIGGHGTGVGGVVVDSGKFDWTDKKFDLYNQPDPGYHDLRFAHDLGPLNPIAYIMRMRLVPLRNLGACIAPDNAWLFLQGLETLPLRMDKHCENALKVAEYLSRHSLVEWVRYPGLKQDTAHEQAAKYFKKGFGGVVVFGIKGGINAGKKFIESLKLISHVSSVGEVRSLAIHPASTTHSQLTEQQQQEGGITADLIRLSVGIEHIDDIIEDIDQSLSASQK